MKRFISLLLTILLLLNCSIVPVLAAPTVTGEPTLIFKYFDVEANDYVPEGRILEVGKKYELEIWLKDIKSITGGEIPIHFNNKTIRMCSYDGYAFKQDEKGEDSNAISGIENADPSNWVMVNEMESPYFSPSKGLAFIEFYHAAWEHDIIGEEKILSFLFETVAEGKSEFRESSYALDGENSSDYSPNGINFYEYGGDAIEYVCETEAKEIGYLVEGVDIIEETLEISEGADKTLEAVISPANATNKAVMWSSENEEIAKVDEDGTVFGVSVGETTISVRTVDGGFIDTCIVKVTDPNIPTTPQNLKIVSQTGASVSFSWTESTGKSGIDGYNIYKDGEKIAYVLGDVCEYTDTDVVEGTEYKYTVEAFYGELKSPMSKELTAKPQAPQITSVVPESQAEFPSNASKNVYVYYKDTYNSDGAKLKVWYKAGLNSEYTEYVLEDTEIFAGKNNERAENYFMFALDPSKLQASEDAYIFRFTVTDKDNCADTVEDIVYSIVFPPSPLKDFQATAGARSIILSWVNVSGYVTKYRLYRDDKADYVELNVDTPYYEDKDVVLGQTYNYYVVAVDKYGQVSEPVYVNNFEPGADTDVPWIVSISPVDGSVINKKITISAIVEDNVGISRTEMYYSVNEGTSWELLTAQDGESKKISYELDTTQYGNKIQVKVLAYDIDGNVSNGLPVRNYTIDNQGPEKVQNLRGDADSATQITLLWDNVSDLDLSHFVVEQKNANGTFSVVDNKVNALGLQITGLDPATSYTYRVVAYDKAGNRGTESNEYTVTTLGDGSAPQITKITPNPQKISENLNMTFVATDDYAVTKITVETSTDGKTWESSKVINAANPSPTVTFSYTLDISELDDGFIYVRAIPEDMSGNKPENIPFIQHLIDRNANTPANVKAEGKQLHIEVSWDNDTTENVSYVVERAESKNGTYSVVATNHRYINYIDENVASGKTYWYKVYAVDDLGNKSEASEPVSAKPLNDSVPPTVDALLPASGSRIKGNSNVTVYANDNGEISLVTLEYSKNGGEWKTAGTSSGKISSINLGSLNLDEGTYSFRAKAKDGGGNESEWSSIYTYTIDNTPPEIKNVSVTPGDGSLAVSWECTPYDDLKVNYLYYKEAGTNSYVKAAERAPKEDCQYSGSISGLSSKKSYVIKIVAVDLAGNEFAFETSQAGENVDGGDGECSGGIVVNPSDKEDIPLNIAINAPSNMTVGIESEISVRILSSGSDIKSYYWTFGDGAQSPLASNYHKYSAVGEYTVTVTVVNKEGKEAIATKKINVGEAEELGTYNITVIDDNGNPVPYAEVVFDSTSGDKAQYLKTDASGRITLTSKPGKHDVGFYKDEYLPTQRTLNFIQNVKRELTVGIVKKSVVIGSLTWKPMTLEEIKEAGIDMNNYENNYVFKYEMTLLVGKETITIEGVEPPKGEPIVIRDKDYVSNSPVGGLYDGGGNLTSNTFFIYDFNDKDPNKGYDYDSEEHKDKAPNTIVTHVQVPGEASWLMEFFDVNLNVYNQAESQYVIKNSKAILGELDDIGLELISGSSEVSMGDIPGQSSAHANWKIKGKKEGEYPIYADFFGELGIVDTESEYTKWADIHAQFESEEPILVYGSKGLTFIVECESRLTSLGTKVDASGATVVTDGVLFRVGLKNSSILTRYNVNVTVAQDDEGKIIPLENYQNYIERKNGERKAFAEDEITQLAYGETMYSEFMITGFSNMDVLKELIIDKLEEASNVDLPMEFKVVEPGTFHSRVIKVYAEDEQGEEAEINTLNTYLGSEATLAVRVSEMLPGEAEYSVCGGVEVYLNDKYIGTTEEKTTEIEVPKEDGAEGETETQTIKDAVLYYTYKAPEEMPASGDNVKLTFKSSKTRDTSVYIHLVDNRAKVKGYVHDTYGNILKGVSVKISRMADDGTENILAETTTNEKGLFVIEEKILAGDVKIELVKDKYKTVSEEINLAAGDVTLMYKMERIRTKPKVVSVAPTKLGNDITKIIVPEGLKMQEVFDIQTNAEDDDKIVEYRIFATSPDGKTERQFVSFTKDFAVDLSQLKAGYKMTLVVTTQSGLQSAPFELPIKVIECPFAHLLNFWNMKVSSGGIYGQINFTDLFRPVWDKSGRKYSYWLSGEALTSWNTLFNEKFRPNIKDLNVGHYNLACSTDFVFDWFAYKGYKVYVDYDFETGELVISPYPVGPRYSMSYSSGWWYDGAHRNMLKTSMSKYGQTTGRVRAYEEVDTTQYPPQYWSAHLTAISNINWDIENLFAVNFKLKNNAWEGKFELSVDDRNRFYGTYLRYLPLNWYTPNYLEGSWYKELDAKDDVSVKLTTSGVNNAGELSFDYNTSTSASWIEGNMRIYMDSNSRNTIYLLPKWRVRGNTQLAGSCYVFGYRYPLFSDYYVNESYDYRDTKSKMAEPVFNLNNPEVLEPIPFLAQSSETSDPDVIETKVLANTEFKLMGEDEVSMIYLSTDENKPSVLVSRTGDTIKEISSSESRAYDPEIANTKAGKIAVWTNENSGAQNADDSSAEKVENNIASKTGIYYATYGALGGTVGGNEEKEWMSGVISDKEGIFEHSPVISSFGDGAIAAWVENEQNQLFSQTRNDKLMFSEYVADNNGGYVWIEPYEIPDAEGTISDLSIVEADGVVHLMYAITEDVTYTPDDSTEEKAERMKKYCMVTYKNGSWSNIKYIRPGVTTDDFCSFIEMDGKLQIIVISGEAMYRIDPDTREVVEVVHINDAMKTSNEMVVASGEGTAIVWITSEENQRIYTTVYKNGSWSEPVEITAISEGYTAVDLSAAFVGDELKVVYNRHKYENEANLEDQLKEVALCKASISCAEQNLEDVLEVLEIISEDTVVMNGSDAKFKIKVKNTGINTLDGFKLKFKDETGNVINSEVAFDIALAGGMEAELEAACPVANLTENITVGAYVGESTGAAAECDVTVENMAIVGLQVNPTDDGTAIAKVVLKNTGYVALNRSVNVYDVTGDLSKSLLGTANVENLAPQEEMAVEIKLPVVPTTVDILAEIMHDGTSETNINDDTKEITYNPISKLILGSVTPLWNQNLFNKTRTVNQKVNLDNITVTAKEGEDTIADAKMTTSEDKASFNVMVPTDEEIEVVVSAPGFLPRQMTNYEYNTEKAVGLFAGDVYSGDDKVINAYDLAAIFQKYNKTKDDAANNNWQWEAFKLADDGVDRITLADINIILSNYGAGQRSYDYLDRLENAQ